MAKDTPIITIHVKGQDEPIVYTDGEAMDFIQEKLDKKFAQLKGFAKKAWGGMSPFDKAALATAPLPVIGDITGLAADVDMYIKDPESRNILNYGMSVAGLLPFVPALSTAKKTTKAIKAADDLPMDEASRMKRAKDMGFDVDTTYYHGTDDADFMEFNLDKFKSGSYGTFGEPSVYSTGSKSHAGAFGDEIKELIINKNNYQKISAKDELKEVYDNFDSYQDLPFQEWIDNLTTTEVYSILDLDNTIGNHAIYAKKAGNSGLIYNFDGIENVDDIVLSFDPKSIRSINAKFDPKMKSSANLLAGGAAATVGTSAYMNRDKDNQD